MRSSTSRIGHGSTMAAGFPADANLGAPAGAAASPGFLRFPNRFIAFIGQVRMTWSRLDDVLRQDAPALRSTSSVYFGDHVRVFDRDRNVRKGRKTSWLMSHWLAPPAELDRVSS